MTTRRQVAGLAGWLLLTFLVAAVGAKGSMAAASFYSQLALPAWAPPAGLFGPVWSVLYLLMAIAAWLVWRRNGWRGAPGALGLYLLQLVCNAAWSWLFFAWRLGAAALADIIVLAALIIATMVAFHRVRPLAALLLMPYLGWVLFAGVLNYTLWQGNPTLL